MELLEGTAQIILEVLRRYPGQYATNLIDDMREYLKIFNANADPDEAGICARV